MQEFVEYIVKNLVDNAEEVNVSIIKGTKGMLIEIRAAKEDLAKIIGKQGKTIKALKVIISGAAARLGLQARIEIIE